MQTERFQTLDGWRGLCAIFVALYHLNAYGHFYEWSLVRNAWLFVDFFFVLSGFVITHAYMDRLGSWACARSFMVRRFGRLWPLHISVLLFLIGLECVKALLVKGGAGASLAPFSGEHSLDSALANVVLVQGLGVYDHFTWNVPSWSISTEFYTYLAFSCVLIIARSRSATLMASFGLIFASIGVVFFYGDDGYGTFQYAFFRTLCGFFVGHLTYRLWKVAAGSFVRWIWPLEIVAVALVVAFISLLSRDGRSLWCFAAPLVFAFTIFVFACERGPISIALNSRPVTLLGERSYSIYMVHASIILILNRAIDVLGHRTTAPLAIDVLFPWATGTTHLIFFGNVWLMDVFALVYLLSVVAVAGFTFRAIEEPSRRYFNSMKWARSDLGIKEHQRSPSHGQSPIDSGGQFRRPNRGAQGVPADW